MKRELVVEHRIDVRRDGLLFRWWLETDPAHGGVESRELARDMVNKAMSDNNLHPKSDPLAKQARRLIRAVSCANSLEVTSERDDSLTLGVAAHKDWP